MISILRTRTKWLVLYAAIGLLSLADVDAEDIGSLQFDVRDRHRLALPCRIHLTDAEGQSVAVEDYPYWTDHFVCDGRASVPLTAGTYTWVIERGPEFARASGKVEVEPEKPCRVVVTLHRIADLSAEGWLSGDLHVHRPVEQIKALMLAEDLRFAPVIGWWNTPAPNATQVDHTEFRFGDGRIYCTQAGEDEREAGALLYFGLRKPLDLSVQSREFPSPMHFVEQASQQNENVWIDIEKPFWWDVPTWLATGRMSSIGIANNHMCRSEMLTNEAWGRPRDSQRLPDPHGNGYWTQEIYYHILNCGIHIPPSAGSASGVLPNPVGYNRVYVQLEQNKFTRDNWFAALRAGRCFVTNGPLLRATANDLWPGTTMKIDKDSLNISLQIDLATNDAVSMVEVIFNGAVVKQIPCDQQQTEQHLSATLEVKEPGWMLLRAIADVEETFRFASTAPWYIEDDAAEERVSRRSTEFFLDWVNDRIERINANVSDLQQHQQVMRWHVDAREYWLRKREIANAE
ncbi:CehA/McbA family metallohydrolase [Planctomycetaceae bacterium SH139]